MGGIIDNTLGTNIFGENAAEKGLQAQHAAQQQADTTAKATYAQQRADQEPWRQAGIKALSGLENQDFQRDFSAGDFQQDPGYQFRMAEGAKALERSAAARGGLNSGATMKALTKYGQDFATNEYSNAYNRFNADRDRRFNRLSSLAGVGQTATNQVGADLGQYGQTVGQNAIGVGNATAAAGIARGNQLANTVGQGVKALAFSDARLKTNVTPVPKAELDEMKKHLKAFAFNYKNRAHGEGDWVGVMAQDLQKSKLGRTLVVENEFGHKMIDIQKVMSLFLATMAEG